MFSRAITALALGRITRAQAESLIDTWRRSFLHYPYPRSAEHTVKRAYADARRLRDRRIIASVLHELNGGYIEDDPGREPHDV
jgi:hypothetical protein